MNRDQLRTLLGDAATDEVVDAIMADHGRGVNAEAEKAKAASKALFSGDGDAEHMPTTELTNDDFGGGSIDVLTLLVKCGLAASKGEARRLVQQGGVTVNDEKVSAIETTFGCEQFTGDGIVIKKGKKVFHRAVLV